MSEKRYEAWVNEYAGSKNSILHRDRVTANRKAMPDRIALRHVVELRDGERIVYEDEPYYETLEEVRARNRELVRCLTTAEERANRLQRDAEEVQSWKSQAEAAQANLRRLQEFAQAVTNEIYVTGADDPIAYLSATRWHRIQSILDGEQ